MKARTEIVLGDGTKLKTTQNAQVFANWWGGSQPVHVGEVELVDRGGSTYLGYVRSGNIVLVRDLEAPGVSSS